MKKLSCILTVLFVSCFFCNAQKSQDKNATEDYLNVYQKYLSGLKNTNCSMYPSCSNYAKMVFQDYSFPKAMVMTADRLTRCSHDLDMYTTTYIYGFPAAVDFPPSRSIPDGLIVDYTNSQVYTSNQMKNDTVAYSNDFIVYLINQKNYQGALYEIDKTLFKLNREGLTNVDLYAYKLKCFEGLKRYGDGIDAFERSFPQKVTNSYSTLFCVARLYDLMGNDVYSTKYYEKAASIYSADQSMAHPYSELGKLYAKQKRYADAKIALKDKLALDNNYNAYNSSIGVIEEMKSFKNKSKPIAMVLSIIPGGGYFYTKQPKSAVTALLLNGTLGYAAYTSFKSKNYGVGAILSVISLSFYLGNIVGASNSAIKYNNSFERKSLDQLHTINPFIN